MSIFSQAAPYYVSLGWKIFPLGAGSKLPAIKGGHGFKDASDDADVIDGWAKAYPRANIAIATGGPSGVIVIDIDPRNGGGSSIAELAGKGLVFPECPEARTGNGGRHLFYAFDHRVKASKDKLGKGVDVKSTGGYVVAAPSFIEASEQGRGGTYRWIRPPRGFHLPSLPKWALDRLTTKPHAAYRFDPVATAGGAERCLEGIARRLARASVGERNNLLNWSAYQAGALVKQGKIGGSIAASRLTQAALAVGLPLPEVEATIASGMRAAMEGDRR